MPLSQSAELYVHVQYMYHIWSIRGLSYTPKTWTVSSCVDAHPCSVPADVSMTGSLKNDLPPTVSAIAEEIYQGPEKNLHLFVDRPHHPLRDAY